MSDSQTGAASMLAHVHACNCVGYCRSCGTCQTWAGHTAEYCAFLVRQDAARGRLLEASAPGHYLEAPIKGDGRSGEPQPCRDPLGAARGICLGVIAGVGVWLVAALLLLLALELTGRQL